MSKGWTVFKRFLFERKVSFALTLLGLLLYAWMIAAFIPTFFKDVEAWKQIIQLYPEEMLAFFGGSGESLFTIEGFLNIEFFNPWWILIMGGFAIAMASAIVGKEVEKKTAEFLLSLPVSRSSLLLSRFLSTLSAIFLLSSITLSSFYLFCFYYDFTLKTVGLFYLFLYGFVFTSLLASLTLSFSLFFQERSKSISITVAILIASYLIEGMSAIYDKLGWVSPFTLFHYYKPYQALKGEISYHILVLLGFFLLFTLASFLIFSRKDIAI
jgi:ABC-2 type transport system permease protein